MKLSTDDKKDFFMEINLLYRCGPTASDREDNLFQSSESPEHIRISQQTGGQDCGVFAMAVSTDPSLYGPLLLSNVINLHALRLYLSGCFEKGTLSLFPQL